jgi:hypothetical protein
MDDGVQYLALVEDRWGAIAVYTELMNEYAERLRALIRRVWVAVRGEEWRVGLGLEWDEKAVAAHLADF